MFNDPPTSSTDGFKAIQTPPHQTRGSPVVTDGSLKGTEDLHQDTRSKRSSEK